MEIFSFTDTNYVELEINKATQDLLSKDRENLIDMRQQAIDEVNGLVDNSDIVQQLESATISLAMEDEDNPDVEGIILGLLHKDFEPYLEFLKAKSAIWNQDISHAVVEKEREPLEEVLNEFLQENEKTTNTARYSLEIEKCEHQIPLVDSYGVNITHQTDWKGTAQPHASKETTFVEEDVVGLQEFATEVFPEYIKVDSVFLHNRITEDFEKHVNDIYLPRHKKFLETINEILGECCGG